MKPKSIQIKEADIKSMVKDYLAIRGIFSFPLLQGLGSRPGLPDRVIHINGHVEYLEIKKPAGKLSPYQVKFAEQCKLDGIPYHVIKSFADIEELI